MTNKNLNTKSINGTIFIDGSNLFGGLTELLKPGEYIDFSEIINIINKFFSIKTIKFYGTYMRTDKKHSAKHRLIVMAQKKFFDSAKNCAGVFFFKGHFSGTGKEKGIDVKLALDMGIGACTDKYDEAVIMTGDADLKHAVLAAREFEKKVNLAVIGSRFPFGIARIVSGILVLDYNGFFKKNIIPNYKNKPKDLTIIDLLGKVKVKRI